MSDENQPSYTPPSSSNSSQPTQSSSNNFNSTAPLQPQNFSSASEQAPQPLPVMHEPSFVPPVPASPNHAEQRPSKWRYVFIVIGFLQAIGIALFLFVMLWAGLQAKSGASGTEFIALILLMTVVPALAVASLVNLIGLPIYMVKQKLHGKRLAFAIISLVVSALLVAYGAYNVYGFTVYPKKLAEESRQKFEAQDRQFAADNAKPEITKDEAIELLKTCKLRGFYYTDQTDKSNPADGGWGELSSTGVVLTKVDGQPYRISIADRLISELVPIAREAQKVCGGQPQFWHDGAYEQFKDGKWYFKNIVVNTMQSGKTKEEAINFMQACKADYFIGYTDINFIKDGNTRSWLEKAEKSTTGIEIVENSPQSYIFASKAMTTNLQDTARIFRQSCYDTKKLYITVDNWIETEYPQGKWTRVNQ